MISLLDEIRSALDELSPRVADRVVDVETARLFVDADADALRRVLVALIDRAVDQYEGDLTVRVTKHRDVARVDVSGDHRILAKTAAHWSDAVLVDVRAINGALEIDGPLGWMTVPLAGSNTPE